MDIIIDTLLASIRMATPLWFAALGGILAERSGVINLALEGFMLIGAFTAAAVAYTSGSPHLGFLAAGLAGAALAIIFGFFALTLRGDQVVVGMGINILSAGITPFLNKFFFQVTGSTPNLSIEKRFILAPSLIVLALFGLMTLWLRSSFSGLWVRFAGENPAALASAGINVQRTRWICVVLSGVCAGWGGATLSTMLSSQFSRNMTAGSGYMAIAAMIIGRWSPLPTALVCLLFGLTEAAQIRLQGLLTGADTAWMLQLIQISPYVLSLLVLAGSIRSSRAPKALGQIDF
ncbi:MAG: ABC transporter permease [Proteobacteria bacterium]|nr:ABC transporter permease [Pseudomonadota bacterium]